jgi:NitT/TauT family transport system permease protein
VVWAVAARGSNPLLVASPGATFDALGELARHGTLLDALTTTTTRLLVGVGIGAALGTLAGVLAGSSRPLAGLLRPTQIVLLGMPPIAMVILALVWFGTDGRAPIVVVAVFTTPVLYQASADALTLLDRQLLEVARAFRLGRLRIVRHFVIPDIAPQVTTGLTIAVGNGVRVVIMAELLAATTGIGAELALARTNLATSQMFAWIAVTIALVATLELAILGPLARRVTRWRSHAGSATLLRSGVAGLDTAGGAVVGDRVGEVGDQVVGDRAVRR